MDTNELRNALSGVKHIAISTDDFIYFQKLKKADVKPITFDEVENNPFFSNNLESRLIAMRCHLLTSLGFAEERKGWRRKETLIKNDNVLRSSDNDFMDIIEKLNPQIDFRIK